VSSLQPPKKTPSLQQLNVKIEELRLMGAEDAWVTKKYPLLSYIFPGTFLLLFFGDPIWWILHIAGLA
jgi:prepilin signal peptidase PulO-like enzyme (type II secretory pathway)